MFLGAYWSERAESEADAAAKIAAFLSWLERRAAAFSDWYPPVSAESAGVASSLGPITAETIRSHLSQSRRDSDGSPMTQLGWQLYLWNGMGVSCSVRIGMTAPRLLNNVVLSFGADASEPNLVEQESILRTMAQVFDPDRAVATSTDLLKRAEAKIPWGAGWLVYERGGDVRPFEVSP